MAKPASRQELIDYCLRSLGAPVVEINVDDDQVEDRIDEAFEFYREFHYDSVEMVYYKAQVTASVVTLDTNVANTFAAGQLIIGSTSGSSATVINVSNTNKMNVWHATGPFTSGETLTAQGGPSATGNVVLGSFDNKYFEVDDSIVGISKVLQLSNKSNSSSMFDVRYQLLLNNIQSLTNTDIIYYSQLKTELQLINDLLTGQKPIQFSRHTGRLQVDMDWNNDVMIGDYVIAEAYKILNPNEYTLVYDDYFLKRYATALIKRQWGVNLKKFEGVQLPGGVVLNGQKIFEEAQEELTALRQTAQDTYQLPIDFFTG